MIACARKPSHRIFGALGVSPRISRSGGHLANRLRNLTRLSVR